MNYNRIQNSVDIKTMNNSKVVIVGAGGSYNLILNFARSGVGNITVLDFDTIDETNIVRQGYDQEDIGKYKVNALEQKVKKINPDVKYQGITKNFLDMSDGELDGVFKDADVLLFLTDSFEAQAFGNVLALRYLKPSIWAGWYAQSRTAELFFQIPKFTPSCFRCAVSPRYVVNEQQQINISSYSNTIFHSELLDSLIGFICLAILHRNCQDTEKEQVKLFQSLLDDDGVLRYNFFHFKGHPLGGNPLFDKTYGDLGKAGQNFVSYWQKIEPELKPKYEEDCPDCKGKLYELTKKNYHNGILYNNEHLEPLF